MAICVFCNRSIFLVSQSKSVRQKCTSQDEQNPYFESKKLVIIKYTQPIPHSVFVNCSFKVFRENNWPLSAFAGKDFIIHMQR